MSVYRPDPEDDDPADETQPVRRPPNSAPLEQYQPIRRTPSSGSPPGNEPRRVPPPDPYRQSGQAPNNYPPYAQPQGIYPPPAPQPARQFPRQRRRGCNGCLTAGCLIPLALLVAVALVYFLAPFRTNFLILGIDRPLEGTELARTDTMILVSVIPLKPEVHMLSIPRDLWVTIDGVGEERINTAHFYAEASQPGSGPDAAVKAVRQNFGVTVDRYLSFHFDGVVQVVDAMGGLDVTLDEPSAGYEPGKYHFNGTEALAFVRSRKNADDFSRMSNGQVAIKAVARRMLSPLNWWRMPAVIIASARVIKTNLLPWELPRVGLAMARGLLGDVDNRTFSREMVTPFTTAAGAEVLLPRWDMINPVLMEMFGE